MAGIIEEAKKKAEPDKSQKNPGYLPALQQGH